MAISKIWSSYKPVSNINTFVGDFGEIFYDENTGELRISNGVTPGGLAISGTVTVSNEVNSVITEPTNGFSELIMTERNTVIERIPTAGLSSIRDITSTTGSGSVTSTNFTELELSTGTTAGSQAVLSTADRGRYQAGTMGQVGIGVRFATDSSFTGTEISRWGYFNEDDGAYFGRDSGGVFVAIRRNGVENNKTYAADWSIDPMDGTGPSGLSWNPEDGNIYQIEYSWYGYGTILFKLIDQDPVSQRQRAWPIHAFRPTENTSLNYPNLPIRAEIDNGDTTSNKSMFVGGRQYSILAKFNPSSRIISENVIGADITNTLSPVMSIRSKSGNANLTIAKFFRGIDAVPVGDSVYIEVRSNVTLTGADTSFGTPGNHSPGETASETNLTATGSTGGEVLWSGFVGATGKGNDIAGSRSESGLTLEFYEDQILTIMVKTFTEANATISLLARWQEEW